ncbi:MAG: type IV pili methyl-accepting chemotaxis transducer N-terminal domain-containing protein [Pseudomonadota bacterium]
MITALLLNTLLAPAGPSLGAAPHSPSPHPVQQVAGTADMLPFLQAGIVEDDGAAMRVYEAGELRMLGQRIATAACAWAAGAPEAQADLVASVAKFDAIIHALKYGDPSLGIPTAETDRRVLTDLVATHDIWDPLHGILDDVTANGPTPEKIGQIAEASYPLLKTTNHLVSVVMAEYSNPTELLQADAIRLDFASRQETLAEQVAKDICLIFLGIGDIEGERAEMIEAAALFEATLAALHDGYPALGIAPPPNDTILAELEAIEAEWAPMRPIIARIAEGGTPTAEDIPFVYANMTQITDHMAELVLLYVEASKLAL